MFDKIKIFIGYDPREVIAFHVLSHSIIKNSSIPVGGIHGEIPSPAIGRRSASG